VACVFVLTAHPWRNKARCGNESPVRKRRTGLKPRRTAHRERITHNESGQESTRDPRKESISSRRPFHSGSFRKTVCFAPGLSRSRISLPPLPGLGWLAGPRPLLMQTSICQNATGMSIAIIPITITLFAITLSAIMPVAIMSVPHERPVAPGCTAALRQAAAGNPGTRNPIGL